MSLIEIYLIVSVIGLAFTGIIWSRTTWLNIALKAYFIAGAAIGAYLLLNHFFPQAGISL